MNTSALIARPYDRFSRFCGRYHLSDGEPSRLGRALWRLYNGELGGDMAGDLPAIERVLLHDHPCGWSTILADWNKRPSTGMNGGPVCFCHGPKRGQPLEITDRTAAEYGCAYAYVLTRTVEEYPAIAVYAVVPVLPSAPEPPDRQQVRTAVRIVAHVRLDAPEPEWAQLDAEAENERWELAKEAPAHWRSL